MTTLDNLLERAYDLERAGDLTGAATLRAQAHGQQQAAPPAAPTLLSVHIRYTEDTDGSSWPVFTIGEGLTRVQITPEDQRDGVYLNIGHVGINDQLDDVITLEDLYQLRDNLTAILADPRLTAGPLAPLSSAPSIRPVPSICDDTADPRHGTQIGVDWVSGPGVPEDVPYVHVPDAPSEHPLFFYPLNENGIPLPELEGWLPHIIALLSDPRLQAARAQYEAASAHLMKKAA